MCKYETENGICEITGIPCDKVPLCTPKTVYIDKEDENETRMGLICKVKP